MVNGEHKGKKGSYGRIITTIRLNQINRGL